MTAVWLHAFLLTAAIEVPLITLFTRAGRLPWGRRASLALAAQLMTHPLVWYVFPAIPRMTRSSTFVLSELWAWLAEAAFYVIADVAPSKLNALGASALANGASLALGFVLL